MRNRWIQMKAVPFISIIRSYNTKETQNKHQAWWAASKAEDAICVSPLCNQRSLNVEEPSSRILLKYGKLQFRGDDCNHGNATPLRSPISSAANLLLTAWMLGWDSSQRIIFHIWIADCGFCMQEFAYRNAKLFREKRTRKKYHCFYCSWRNLLKALQRKKIAFVICGNCVWEKN